MTSLRVVLVALQAFQTIRQASKNAEGSLYGPGFFDNRDWVKSLATENRRVSVRLARYTSCYACGKPMPLNSTGDHLIPLADGGPQGAQNYAPLCPDCNTRKKRTQDAVEWWMSEGRNIADWPDDVICAYARVRYQLAAQRGTLEGEVPPYLEEALSQVLEALPPAHASRLMAIARSAR
jgi:hypothetical protein